MTATTKRSRELTLHDLLSRLGYTQACKLLGSQGAPLMREGGKHDIDPSSDATLTHDELRVHLPSEGVEVRVTRSAAARGLLSLRCSRCKGEPCVHAAAVLSLVLEEKMALGLAAPPPERAPVEALGEEELVARAIAERTERAKTERMRLRSADPARPWTDYTVTSTSSGKTYRVALRGEARGASYCSCPDYRKNTLGTCKHVLYVLERARRRFSPSVLRKAYRRSEFSLHLRYGDQVELCLAVPDRMDSEIAAIVRPLLDRAIDDLPDAMRRVRRLSQAGYEVKVYPDAEAYLEERALRERLSACARAIRADVVQHPLRQSLLRVPLLPYQLDGIAFAVGAGRAVLADDMGLGKTIQGIGVAELLAREAGIRRVLVICPTSLKAQWQSEIRRFSSRDCRVVLGTAAERAAAYAQDAFFTVCNYEQVLRDLLAIEQAQWDLIVLDEGQRIKNWEAKTSRVIKSLRSRFALVLSGTPLENRLDELYSVVEFVDDRRLGPAFRFLNRHRMVDERGRVLGYTKLSDLRARLAPVLLRRTRADVLKELPPRSTEILRIAPTAEQLDLHEAHMRVVSSIVRKRFISEMDLLRLQKALLMCRMAADGTFLVDKQLPGYSSKLEELAHLLGRLGGEQGRKVVLFSEWTSMLSAIEPLLDEHGLRYVRLDGSVPQKKRADLVRRFHEDPKCAFFLATNAGSTGLNLQVADTLVNVDLPWNPAVLEQRIARVHRMGQARPVQVFLLVTEGTIEEKLMATLAAKQDLALAALDAESETETVELGSGLEELRNRLEVLLGAKPEAALDVSESRRVSEETARLARKERVAEVAGQMLAGAFQLLRELLPESAETEATRSLEAQIAASFVQCLDRDEAGRLRLTVTLPQPLAGSGGAAASGESDPLSTLAWSLAHLSGALAETTSKSN